jgi:hypothetical protein
MPTKVAWRGGVQEYRVDIAHGSSGVLADYYLFSLSLASHDSCSRILTIALQGE